MASVIKSCDEFFEQLDKRYAEERRHIESVAERFPSLDDILKGKDTLVDGYRQLHNKYSELKPTLKDSVNPKAFSTHAKEYVSELTSFVRMIEEISGLTHYYEPERMLEELVRQQELRLADDVMNLENNLYWGLLGGAIFMPVAPVVSLGMISSSLATYIAAKKMKKRLQEKARRHPTLDTDVLFTYLWMTASLQDWRIKRLYAPEWFSTNREAFESAYVSMKQVDPDYPDYVEHALLKQLGAGILPGTDEIGLAGYLHALKGK